MGYCKKAYVFPALVIWLAATGTGQANSSDTDANARLAFSDKLSMYSQRIASSACAFTSEEPPFESRGFLAVANIEVNRILNALENGDLALGISSPEENDSVNTILSDISDLWVAGDAISQSVLRDGSGAEHQDVLEQRMEKFTNMSLRLVATISNQYLDNDALHLNDAIRLQIAGRQRMLSQQISLHACKLHKEDSSEVREALAETIRLFEVSAEALRNGMPEAGLIATQNPKLIAALDSVDKLWLELKWPLRALERPDLKWDAATQNAMYLKLNELTHEMDKAVVSYTKEAGNSDS